MDVLENHHKHKCKFCGYVWQHHNCNDVRHGDSGAHECPNCDRCNWSLGIYDGDEEPKSINGESPSTNNLNYTIHSDQLTGE